MPPLMGALGNARVLARRVCIALFCWRVQSVSQSRSCFGSDRMVTARIGRLGERGAAALVAGRELPAVRGRGRGLQPVGDAALDVRQCLRRRLRRSPVLPSAQQGREEGRGREEPRLQRAQQARSQVRGFRLAGQRSLCLACSSAQKASAHILATQ